MHLRGIVRNQRVGKLKFVEFELKRASNQAPDHEFDQAASGCTTAAKPGCSFILAGHLARLGCCHEFCPQKLGDG